MHDHRNRPNPGQRAVSRFWYRASVQTKYLLMTVPLALALTVGGHALRQYHAGERAIASAVTAFDLVGRRTADALASEIWNYNVTQAAAIMRSLMLIPDVVQVASVEIANGRVVAESPFAFEAKSPGFDSPDASWVRRVQFPIQVQRPSAQHDTVGLLTITYSLANQESENQQLFVRTVLNALGVALLLILGVVFALNRAILRPIEWVSASAKQPDDAFEPITLNSGDQLGRLVSSFNELRLRHIESTRQLKNARDEAIEANAAKSRFLAMMSHELRTPLNAVIGYSEMLQEELAEEGVTDTTQDDLNKIKSAGRHLLELINSVLDLSKIEADKIELEIAELSVHQLVDYVSSTAQPLIETNGNRLVLAVPEDIGPIHSDATRLRQVLLNLLSNAAKFTRGGVVTLSARLEQAAGAPAQMVFDVRDTGIGMSQAQQDKLFEPFVQADSATTRKYGGTGLGLAISRRLCRLLGGDVTVASSPGQGACFTARVLADARPVVRHEGEAVAENPAG
ncbi:MAG: ATP-binding protein [Burkholderiaceae bacterium]